MEIGQYRKKPVVIEAVRIVSVDDLEPVMQWCDGEYSRSPAYVAIRTLEGEMQAEVGDWVIKGIEGEFYPCKHSVFTKTYELVDGSKSADFESSVALLEASPMYTININVESDPSISTYICELLDQELKRSM